jgi:immune inhibitor A
MSAWSKEFLGWADVETLPPGTDLGTLTLPPVQTTGKIYRLESGDGSQEYILLENRQRMGFDASLYAPGLLVWHVDPVTIAQKRFTNSINTDPNRMGVWLRQANGLNRLAQAGSNYRGSSGDPFPGSTGNAAFHAGSNPSSWTHGGEAMGITLLDIQQAGEGMSFQAYTRYQTVTLQTEGAPSGTELGVGGRGRTGARGVVICVRTLPDSRH